jgi:hypothetical protein
MQAGFEARFADIDSNTAKRLNKSVPSLQHRASRNRINPPLRGGFNSEVQLL